MDSYFMFLFIALTFLLLNLHYNKNIYHEQE